MQATSSGWAHNIAKSFRNINYGLLMSFERTTATGVRFFTINQSRIGGPDIIKGGGSFVTFYDKFRMSDYSRYATSFSVSRKLGQLPYGTIMAQADFELDNTSKLFMPGYDATIGSGILPNRPVKLSIGVEGEHMKLFVGFTGQPQTTLNKRRATFHAFDAFDFINKYEIAASGVYTNQYYHQIVADLLQQMGFSSSQYALDTSLQDPIGYLATDKRLAGDVLKEGAEAEQGLLFVDENGIVRFWNRQHFVTLSGTQAFNFSYSSLEDIEWQNTPVINDVIVKARPRAVQAVQKLWEQGSARELETGDNEIFVNFTDKNGDALPVTSVQQPVYVTSASGNQSLYATNAASDGSGAALNSYVTLSSVSRFSDAYKMVFNNSYSSSVYLTRLEIYATPAPITNVIEERYNDAASIESYGRNPANNAQPIIIENDLIQSSSTAASLAYTLVREYKDPGRRFKCPVAVGSNPAWQIGDWGTIRIEDLGVTYPAYITGIENQLQRNGDYKQIVEVESRRVLQYFQIGVSSIGGPHAIAP